MSMKTIVRGIVAACSVALGLNAWADLTTDFTQVTSKPDGWAEKSYRSAKPFNYGANGAVVPGWNQSQLTTSYTVKNTDEVTIDVSTYANGKNNNVVFFLASANYSLEIGNSYDGDPNVRIGAYAGDASTKFASFQSNPAFATPESSTVIGASTAINTGNPLTYHLSINGAKLEGTVTETGSTADPISFEFTLPETYAFTTFGFAVDAAANAAGVKSVSITGGSVVEPLTVAVDTTMTPAEIEAYPSVIINEGVTLTINAESAATLTKTISGAGKLAKIGEGTLTLTSGNSYTGGTTISAGAIALGANNALGPTGSAVTVGEGATLDVNAKADYLLAITLDGGTLKNSGGNIGTSSAQIKSLTLTKDSTIVANGNFGIVNSGHAATTLTLNEHKLTKQGSAEFWLVTVTSDAGTIQIDEGTIHVDRYASTLAGVSFTLPVDETTTDMIIQNATVVNPAPAGTVYQQVERQGGETIYVANGSDTVAPTYVLAAGNVATLKDGDVIVIDSHYHGQLWGQAPSFENFRGHKCVVSRTMNLKGGIVESQPLEITEGSIVYLYGGMGDGSEVTGAGVLYVGYDNNAIGNATIACGTFGIQPNDNAYTVLIDGYVTVADGTTVSEGKGDNDFFKLNTAVASMVVTTKLSDGKVISGVDGYTVKVNEGKVLVSYTLVPAFPPYVDEAHQAAYTAWTTTGAAAGYDLTKIETDLAARAFALNCAPTEGAVDAEMLKFYVVIEFDAEGPQVAIPAKDPNYNIVPVVQGKVNLTDTEWTALEGGAVGDNHFFRAVIIIPGQDK